jgi:hypothetical protein
MICKIKVTEKDHRYFEWDEPFDGILISFVRMADSVTYACVVNSQTNRFHLVPYQILEYVGEE